jgi:hypothetical protein
VLAVAILASHARQFKAGSSSNTGERWIYAAHSRSQAAIDRRSVPCRSANVALNRAIAVRPGLLERADNSRAMRGTE